MYLSRRLCLFIAIVLLLQLGLTNGSATQVATAATDGPRIVALSPADDVANVPLNSSLKITFDENVRTGPSTALINIYKSANNQLVEGLSVTSSRVRITPSNQREVTITPQLSETNNRFELNTDYYVLIDSGAFTNVSNGAAFAGIHNATVWNFRTVAVEDTTKPLHTARFPEGAGHPITTAITISFNEPVFAAAGHITIRSTDDTRMIPVTSSSVTGSGTMQMTIRPDGALLPNTDYEVIVGSNNFQDAAGNTFDSISWNFRTGNAPVNLAASSPLSPANRSTLVPVESDLIVRFDQPVQANAGRYVEIRRVSDNHAEVRLEATSPRISLGNGNTTATIDPASNLSPNTLYYVWIDAGAFSQPAPNENQWFYGISATSIWSFTTGYGNDTTPPAVTAYSPARNGTASSVNTLLTLTFNEEVFPHSGNIEIRTVNGGTLFRSIPVTSARVTGGGSRQLVIDPNKHISNADPAKSFVNNTQYYVTIGNRVIRDGAGNFYGGLSGASGWSFTIAHDAARPMLNTLNPPTGAVAVGVDTEFAATFNKAVRPGTGGNNKIYFIPSSASSSLPTIEADFRIDPADGTRILIKPRAPMELVRNTNYHINIEDNAITDMAGNAFIGILNQHQWAFLTVGGDTTPPAVTRAEVSGSTIRIIYNEPLNANLRPSPASYYVTVAGAPRNVTAARVEGNMVVLTLASAAGSNQKVVLSYTKPATGLVQDLSGNQAAAIANLEVTNGTSGTAPTVTSGSAAGNTIILNFNQALMPVNAYAFTQFTVNIGGTNYSPTSIWHSGSVVQLTVNPTITSGQSIFVSYSPSSYPLTGTSGHSVGAFSNYNPNAAGGGSGDTSAPYVLYISASGNSVVIKYNKSLNPNNRPNNSQYNVFADNATYAVNSVQISGDSVYLSLGTSITGGQNVRVSYNAQSNTVTDYSGNAAASFANITANSGTGTGQPGALQRAFVKGSLLTLAFNEALNAASVPTSNQFLVRVNDSVRMVSNVQINGSVVLLTLGSPVNATDTVQVTYLSNTNILKTNSGLSVSAFSNVRADNETSVLDMLGGDYEAAVGGGIAIKSSGATMVSDSSPSGVTANRYTVDNNKFITAVTTSQASGIANQRIVFKVPDHERAALVAISLIALETASRQNDATFAVQHGDATFEIPLRSLNYSELSAAAGGNNALNQILLVIDKNSTSESTSLTTALNTSSAQVIAGPVNYEAYVLNGSVRNKIERFNGYVSRTLRTSTAINTSQTAAVWRDPATGVLSYVPTVLERENGVTTATFKRKGNSAYALIRNTSSFSDMAGHWSADTVQMMARKFIVEGHSVSRYEPEKAITRGEFATYIAKGLGLAGDREAAAKFGDVNKDTAMGAYIGAAAAAGIVNGVSNTSFQPNRSITRQDMAAMMMRAAKVAGMTVTLPSSADMYLAPFADRGSISNYAKTDMALAVYVGIINGKSPTRLSPTDNATRAEGAVMIQRLLEKAEFLTP